MKKCSYDAEINMRHYEKTFKYDNIDVLILSIKYPVISMPYNKNAEHYINHHIEMNVNSYMRYASHLYDQAVRFYYESQENNFPFNSFSAYMEYNITYNANCILSMYIDKYEFTGGAHGSTVRSSETFDLCSGKELHLNSIFKPGTDYKSLLIDEITIQANYNLQENPGIYFEDYKGLIIKNFDQDSYYLTPYGLVIYYQQYDIAPYSTGIVEFTIPYRLLGWYPKCRK